MTSPSTALPQIVDTYAEAFDMRFARLIVTAIDEYWLQAGLAEFCGYGTSVIQCDAEVGVEQRMACSETPDGRPGASVLLFGFSAKSLGPAIVRRVGQCLLTCPSTAVFDGLPDAVDRHSLGGQLRYFGDGYQKSKRIGRRRLWRIPVMDGEFLVEHDCGIERGIGGGNILIQCADPNQGLAAARAAVESIADTPETITPFPGGVVRSGSKVGSRYSGLVASTHTAFCPTLVGRVESELHPDAVAVYEIVVDGATFPDVARALKKAILAAHQPGIVAISAGNYGGNLGKHHFYLHQLLADEHDNPR